jgi:hypothetical protein
MINTNDLNPKKQPKTFFGADPETGACVELDGTALKEAQDGYANELARYKEMVDLINQTTNDKNILNIRNFLVQQARAMAASETYKREAKHFIIKAKDSEFFVANFSNENQLARGSMSPDQNKIVEQMIPILEERFRMRDALADRQNKILSARADRLNEERSTGKLLDAAVAAIITRKATDKTISELNKNRFSYRNLESEYVGKTDNFESIALKTDAAGDPVLEGTDGKSIKTLVDIIDLEARGTHISPSLSKKITR